MNTFLIVIAILLSVIVILLIIAKFKRKDYEIRCEIIIESGIQSVFNYIKQLKNQNYFNKWVMVEPNMEKVYKGIDGETGFIYYWKGKKAGEGELELTKLQNGKLIETEIRFVKPFESVALSNYYFESISENKTNLVWTNKSEMIYPLNLLLPMVQKMLTKDMNISLNNLKDILEKQK